MQYLNRNEFALHPEDELAQRASVRRYIETGNAADTELFRLGINPAEPFQTWTPWDQLSEDEQAYRLSVSSRQHYWCAYADGKTLAKIPADGLDGYRRARDILGSYIARQRIMHHREPEAACIEKVSAGYIRDLGDPDRPDPRLDSEQDDPEILAYIEGITEAAMLGIGEKRPVKGCD